MNLAEALSDSTKKPQVVRDCVDLIEREVGDKGGLSGMALKAAYGAVKGIKPGFVQHVVEGLLPDFARVLTPMFDEANASGKDLKTHFTANSSKVADALLSITDDKAARSQNGVVRSAYPKLRGSAKGHVEAAVPKLADLLKKYV